MTACWKGVFYQMNFMLIPKACATSSGPEKTSMPGCAVRVARALEIVGQGLVRGFVVGISLKGRAQPAQAVIGVAVLQKDFAHLTAQVRIFVLPHDLLGQRCQALEV